ncbi:MAG: hypothetical protein GXP47_03085 [Acidobacteria bacterium]|nr:hypothetical protein [Acidobacteriota bacterium]
MSETISCPLCGARTRWDSTDERFECDGIVQHCFVAEGNGRERVLVLVASGSGEDCDLFETFPWPGAGGTP